MRIAWEIVFTSTDTELDKKRERLGRKTKTR